MPLDITVISLFPEMFTALNYSITGLAQQQQLIKLTFLNPRDFTDDPHKTVDDRPYGGGPGMVMKYQPMKAAIDAAKRRVGTDTPVVHLSPQGNPLNQKALFNLSQQNTLILLASRYEGVDERLLQEAVDIEYSVGDYVVSGGELPAMILIDGLTRLIPGALGHKDSATTDSFSHGLLDHPHYTRPEVIAGHSVPKILLSGDHASIERWRLKEALGRTWQKRPDLLKRRTLNSKEQPLLDEYQKEHSEPDGEEKQ